MISDTAKLYLACCVLLFSQSTAANENDSIPESKPDRNFFQKVSDYFKRSNDEIKPGQFDVTFIGGPHYSDEKKFGIGLLAAGLYRPKDDYTTPPSNVSLSADVSTVGYYQIGLFGNHINAQSSSRIIYDLYFSSFPTYFWGIGYEADNDNSNKSKYKKIQIQLKAEWLWKISKDLYLGPSIDFSHISAVNRENPVLWQDYAPRTFNYGVGATFSYDKRDNLTAPNTGMYFLTSLKYYPSFLFNKNSFSNWEITYSQYFNIWKGGIIAYRLHGFFSMGHKVPWGLLASFGGSYNMRGYYQGRYTDRNEADVTVELRQHVWRRSGIVFWLGAGEIFPDLKSFKWNHLLPSTGIGYRWEFKKNVNIRFDFGIGKKSTNFIFSINEAF